MISSLTLLLNSLGLRTEWRVIQGTADFFSITKKMHNALQGGEIDLSRPNEEMWKYLRRWIDKYDAVIVSSEEYKHEMKPPQHVFMPAINPFNIKNRELSDKEIDERLAHYKIPTDLPLVVQISRFDPWKDPEGVVKAFKLARKEVEATLVLLGNFATDDPEGSQIFESLRACQEERILILTKGDDTAL